MLHDILIPSRIGSYYLQNKRILSFEITPMMVQGLLIEFSGRSIQIKNKQSILLKDLATQTQTNALKKIASNIGKYDEIVTTLSSSAIVYKELRLPFIGRDALAMIVPYEVESLLPFALEEAVIDFIITKEDFTKKESTLLVAAIRIQDLEHHQSLFEKAELNISVVTIDIFALYEIYKASLGISKPNSHQSLQSPLDLKSSSIVKLWHTTHTKIFKSEAQEQLSTSTGEFQPKQAELFIDIGCDVTRVLYFQDTMLTCVRIIPLGICDIAQTISQTTEQPYFDVIQNIITINSNHNMQTSLKEELKKLFEEIIRTLQFFEKQEAQQYINPHKIWFSGFATTMSEFLEQAQTFFNNTIEIIHSTAVAQRLNITIKSDDQTFSFISLALSLFVNFEPNVNFLNLIAKKDDYSLLNKQLIMIVMMTILCLGSIFWKSSMILKEQETAYNSSKRQFMQAIEQRLHIDLHGEKSIKTMLDKAEEKLKKEKALWLVFSAQQEHSVLEYLQDLSVQIDRASVGLQVRNMHLDYEKVTMAGSVKSFETKDVFEEELQSLQLLQLIEKPRELSFTIQFKPKDKGTA